MEPPAKPPRTPEQRRRRLRRIAAVALLASVACAGAAGGWWLRSVFSDDTDTSTPADVAVAVIRPLQVQESSAVGSTTTPSVTGLPLEQAEVVFFDAGFAVEGISVQRVPAAGEPGLVLQQDPSPGAPLGDAVVLFVSETAVMPDLVGEDSQTARETLAAFGARTVVSSTYEDGTDEGRVLRTDPPAGTEVPYEVEVVIAEPPSSVSVVQLRPVSNDCSRRDLSVNGTPFDDVVVCDPDREEILAVDYVLNRDVARFDATIGLGDRGVSDVGISFRAFVDGELVGEWVVAYGTSTDISVPVLGALGLRLETERVTRRDESGQTEAVIADGRFVGSRDAIDRLIEESG